MTPVDLSLLAPLDALLQEGSVTRAARRMGLSTPAMSHCLARIRTQLGDPVLVRAGRTMVLTPRAESLKPRVRALVTEATAALSPEAVFAPASMRRAFVVSASDHVLTVLGATLDAAVRDAAPGVALRFVPVSADDAGALREGALDLAVGIYGQLPPELRTRPLLTDRFVCVVRHDHPDVGARLSLEDFVRLDHVQVAPRGQPGGYVDDQLRLHGLSRNVARAVPYFVTALHLVAQSDYVLTVSERVVRALAPTLRLRVLAPPLDLRPYALSLVWHPRFDADPGHRWLRERFVDAAQATAGDAHPRARTQLDPGDPTAADGRTRPRRTSRA